MKCSLLHLRLHSKIAKAYISEDSRDIESSKLLSKNIKNFESDVIYIGQASDLPASLPDNCATNFLCVGTDISKYLLDDTSINIMFFADTMEIADLYNEVKEILHEQHRYEHSINILLNSLIENHDLQFIIDLGYEMLRNPILMTDFSFKPLMYTKRQYLDDPCWNDATSNGFPTSENMRLYIREKYFEKIKQADKPFFTEKGDLFGVKKIITKLTNMGKYIGVLVVFESSKIFDERDLELTAVLANVISVKMQEMRRFYSYSENLFEDLIRDILSNNIHDAGVIAERLSYMNWRSHDKYYVLSVDITTFDQTNLLIYYLRDSLKQLTNNLVAIPFEDYIVIIIGYENGRCLDGDEAEKLQDYLKDNCLIAGLSQSFTKIADLHKYYKQTQKCIEMVRRQNKNNSGLFLYDNYALDHLLQICSTQANLMDFCHSGVLQLMEYDKVNKTSYLMTLYAYLKYDRSLAMASNEVFIHRNTVTYRLSKIQSITGLDINDRRIATKLEISLRILDHMGLLS